MHTALQCIHGWDFNGVCESLSKIWCDLLVDLLLVCLPLIPSIVSEAGFR